MGGARRDDDGLAGPGVTAHAVDLDPDLARLDEDDLLLVVEMAGDREPGSTQLRSTLTLLAPCSLPDSQRPATPFRIRISGSASVSMIGMVAA